MSRRFIQRRIDDLDGSPAGRTVRFSLDGVVYEIDLNAANLQEMQERLAPFMSAARRLHPERAGLDFPLASVPNPDQHTRGQLKAIRRWAIRHGIDIDEDEPVPLSVLHAFHNR